MSENRKSNTKVKRLSTSARKFKTLSVLKSPNAVEVEEAVSDLVLQPFDRDEFPFQFLKVQIIRIVITKWRYI